MLYKRIMSYEYSNINNDDIRNHFFSSRISQNVDFSLRPIHLSSPSQFVWRFLQIISTDQFLTDESRSSMDRTESKDLSDRHRASSCYLSLSALSGIVRKSIQHLFICIKLFTTSIKSQ